VALLVIVEMGTEPRVVPGYDMLCASDSIHSLPYIITFAQIRSITQL